MLTEAPAATAIAAALIAGVLYATFNWMYQSVITQKDAAISGQQITITNLNSTVSDLRAEIASFRIKLAEKSVRTDAGAAQAVQRDLDGVYQSGHQVGSVIGAEVSLSTGKVTFGRIYNAASFAASKDFEYKDLVLHVDQLAGEIMGTMFGGPPQRALLHVACNVVGRRPS